MGRALLGGGCFWCTEGAFKQIKGINSALPAYAGGHVKVPTYRSVCDGNTGHAEIVEVVFDSIISFETILDVFLLLMTRHNSTDKAMTLALNTVVVSCLLMKISVKLQSTK